MGNESLSWIDNQGSMVRKLRFAHIGVQDEEQQSLLLCNACEKGDLDLVEIMTSKFDSLLSYKSDMYFKFAIQGEQESILEYLLTVLKCDFNLVFV